MNLISPAIAITPGGLGFVAAFFPEHIDTAVFGTVRWVSRDIIRSFSRLEQGLLIGREPTAKDKPGKLLRHDGVSHMITLASTRSGKGVGTIILNPPVQDRPIICVDPKGENARIAARRKFGPVYILDPFGVSGQSSTASNPVDGLDASSPDLAEDAAAPADALVCDPPGQVGEVHWNEEARAFIASVIMHVMCCESESLRTLVTVRKYLTLPPTSFGPFSKPCSWHWTQTD